jgi:hypothetical protein
MAPSPAFTALETDRLFLGGLFDVLDDRLELLHKLFVAITDAVQVGAQAGYDLGDPTGFPDLLVTYSKQRKLRCVKGDSVLTVIGRRRAKADQCLLACRKRRVAHIERHQGPVLLEDNVWRFVTVVGNETESLLDLIENFLSTHWNPPWVLLIRFITTSTRSKRATVVLP